MRKLKTHIRTIKHLGVHVAKRGDHLAEIAYFSSIAFIEHGIISIFGFTALGFTVLHVCYTFSQVEHELHDEREADEGEE